MHWINRMGGGARPLRCFSSPPFHRRAICRLHCKARPQQTLSAVSPGCVVLPAAPVGMTDKATSNIASLISLFAPSATRGGTAP